MNITGDDAVWRALADPTRRQILETLASDKPASTGTIVERFAPHLVRTAVMKHLDVLTSAKLIRVERIGRTRNNYPDPRPLKRVADWLDRHVEKHEKNLTRLKKIAESNQTQTKPKQTPKR